MTFNTLGDQKLRKRGSSIALHFSLSLQKKAKVCLSGFPSRSHARVSANPLEKSSSQPLRRVEFPPSILFSVLDVVLCEKFKDKENREARAKKEME